MSYRKSEGTYRSADGRTDIHYYRFLPDGNPTAILQISHGMSEYLERYESEGFVGALTDAGIIVCGNDHLGHGKSVASENDFGYFEDYRFLAEDLHTLNGIMRKTYPRLPYLLFGHSMGSFAARIYAVTYEDIDGAVFCGTSAGNQPLGPGRALAVLIGKVRGGHHRSGLLRAMSFAGYNRRFAREKDELSWLTSLAEVRERYRNDPLCGIAFTDTGCRELFAMLAAVSDDSWADAMPLSLPVLLISGEDDPVGDNGEGVREVAARLEERELCSLTLKLYPGSRHEIFNDVCRDEMMRDLIAWIRETAEGVVAARTLNAVPFGRQGETVL